MILFPVEATMVIIMKNIILTLIMQEFIMIREFPAESITETTFLSLIGSIRAAVSLYINAIISIFIIGSSIITIITINPIELIAFYKSTV